MSDIRRLNILYWNCRGIRNKKTEFFDFLISNNIHIACLCETKLNSDIRFSNNQFHVYRLDNAGGRISKGGVAIVVHKSIKCNIMKSLDTEIIETIGITISSSTNQKVNILSTYFTGTTSNHDYAAFVRDIRKITSPHTIAFGDFNSKHSYWRCQRSNKAGRILYNEMLHNEFEIYYPHSPTYFPGYNRTPSTLDIALSTSSVSMESITTTEDLASDHLPVLVSLSFDCTTKEYNTTRCYSKANWMRFARYINRHINIRDFESSSLTTRESIDECIVELTKIVNRAAEISIPLVKKRPQHTVLPKNIKRLIMQRKSTKRYLDRTGHRLVRNMYNNVKALVERLCFLQTNKTFQNYIKTFEPNHNNNCKLWKMTRILRGKFQQLPFFKQGNQLLLTDSERAEALAENFLSNHHTTTADRSLHRIERDVKNCVKQIHTTSNINDDCSTFATPKEIRHIIKQLPNKKAAGEDQITNSMIKNGPRKFVVALTYIINACIMLSYFPNCWKLAITVPIRKPGKPADDVASYRPISLLSCLSKILERVILKRINAHLEETGLIPNFQFGFRPQHSTSHQLLRVTNQIRSGISHKKSTGMVLLDLKAAFDSVWHGGLVYKMKQANFPHYLTKMVQSFLTNRSFKVKVNGVLSETKNIPAGVPQGAVLSPVLFNIFMSDLPTTHNCNIAQYADDIALLNTNIRAASIKKSLQAAVKCFSKYLKHWKLKLNPSKTEAVFFTRRRAVRAFPKANIIVEGHSVTWGTHAKYLGAILDQKLTLKKHVDHVIEKGGKCVKMMYSLLSRNSKLDKRNKITLYKTVLRPILTYPSPIVHRAAVTHNNRLQLFQNRILKMGLNLPWNHSTADLHDLANIEKVSDFIERLSLKFEEYSRLVDNPLVSSLYDL